MLARRRGREGVWRVFEEVGGGILGGGGWG